MTLTGLSLIKDWILNKILVIPCADDPSEAIEKECVSVTDQILRVLHHLKTKQMCDHAFTLFSCISTPGAKDTQADFSTCIDL